MNPTPADIAFLEVLNRPILPELSINLIDALSRAFRLAGERDPNITAQQFIERLLASGITVEMDEHAARRMGLQPERDIFGRIHYR